ncbi:host attachment protein [Acidocella sp.]|uniref:baeRF12 domain-containing protein n=1 Tax=Acidocella sp. TaxID=50710 RepID=UPI003D0433D1
MPIHLKTLIVLADGEHARFVRPQEADNTLCSFSRADPRNGHEGTAGEAHAESATVFPDWVAGQLNQGVESYDELYLVAPARALNEIRLHLAKPAQGKLKEVLDKDLTKVPDHDLWPHFKHWVRPVHRAR